jgi:hypothetical protein
MAAEFKIGRLRFTWAGAWEADKFYNRDAVVHYQGKTYVCLVPNTSDADFYNDLNAIPFPYWELVVDGKTWMGPWTPSTVYSLGDIVTFGGKVYYCSTQHTSTAFAIDAANWTEYAEFSNWLTNWTVSTVYGKNDIVKYGGIVYKCLVNHTSAATIADGLEANQSNWTIYNSGIEYKGNWLPSTRYKINDVIKLDVGLYKANLGHTSIAAFEPLNWDIWVPGVDNFTTWDSATVFQIGDAVRYGGYDYISITSNNQNNTPSVSSSNWQLLNIGYQIQGAWSTNNSYKVGDVVTKNGQLYEAVADNSAQDPAAFALSTTYTAAGSSGTTLKVSSNTGITTGMIINGVGFTLGQTVVSVVNSDTVILDRAPDGAPVDGQSLKFVGLNYVYWKFIVPGTYWTKTWVNGTMYTAGDLAVWQNATYICIQNHTATSVFRPDLDVANTYWSFYVSHFKKNALNTIGDIEAYNNNQYTAVPIGTDTFSLRSTNLVPTWSHINSIPKVFYVSTFNGRDVNTEGWGATWDKPWKSIAYACSVVAAGTNYPLTNQIIQANRIWLVTEMYQWMVYQQNNTISPFYSGSSFNATKTVRDAGYVIDALCYDLTRGGNSQTVAAALAYFAFGSTNTFFNSAVNAEMPLFIAGLNQLLFLIQTAISGSNLTTSYQTLNNISGPAFVNQNTNTSIPFGSSESTSGAVVSSLMNIIITALTTQSTAAIPATNTGTSATIFVKTGTYQETLPIAVPENTAIVGDELRGVTVEPAVRIVTKVTASNVNNSNLFTASSTAGFTDQMPVQFASPDIATATGIAYTGFGGITPGQTYYIVGSTITSTSFGIAQSPTTTFVGSTTLNSNIIDDIINIQGLAVGATVTGPGIPDGTTINTISTLASNAQAYNIALSANATVTASNVTLVATGAQVQLSTYTGGNMTVYAGDCLKDMFRLRNGTGLRNMTLTGLLGTLSAPDSNVIQRPTGGSFACLDPGTGPNDSSSWIFRRSPYVQNVTAFGDGCTALKIDGNLHNGGNKSIVCNDFTHIVNDGIGIWCTGPSSLTEAVSVFSYYGYAGYFAEAGGRIRATNGNTSYGIYGVIAEGYDTTETPASGTIYNQSSQVQATVQQAYGSNSQLLRIQYSNAGSAYTSTTTNMLNYSNNFLGTGWTSDGNLSFAKTTIAPTGLTEAWSLTGGTGGPDGSYVYQNIAIPSAGAKYIGLTAVNITGNGGVFPNTPATFDITVTSTSYVVVVNNPGSGYATTNTMYISGSQLGGVNSVNDCIITVTGLTGSGVQQVSVTGTVPLGSALNYTLSLYIKKGTAPTIDIYGIFSGSSTVTSSISYDFTKGTATVSNAGGGFLPTQYGVINQQLSSTSATAGWYRLWFTINDTTGLNTNLQFKIYPRGYNGTANQYTYIYGSQVELSKSTYKPNFYLQVDTISKYTAYANYNITGAGTGAVTIGDEVRSNSVFQTRVVTDANGVTGGAGFLTASNNAQAGSDQFIQLAQSDTNTNGNYTGMRIFVNSGTGAGQYGYISYYNASTKYAYVLKESFDTLQVSSTSSTGNLFTLNGAYTTETLYVDQPVQFIPTYYTTSVTSTGLSQTTCTAAHGGTDNTLTVSSTSGMYVNMPLTFSANGAFQTVFSAVSAGYTYYIYAILDNTTIQITQQSFGNVWPLNTASGTMTINFPSNTSYLQASTTNMIVNYPIQFTGTALGGVSVGTVYYINDIIDSNNFTISGSLVTTTVTATNASNKGLTVSSTASLTPLQPVIFSAPVIGSLVEDTKYYISSIIDNVTFTVATSLITGTVTKTEVLSNLITVSDTTNFVQNQPIRFVGTSFDASISSETTYYILVINTIGVNGTFTISQTPGGGAVNLIGGLGSMTAITCPTPYQVTSQGSGTMTATTTSKKSSLNLGIGTMNATFSTSLYGGVTLGQTYYINTIPGGSTFTVTSTKGSGLALNLNNKSGSMNIAAVGWDHLNVGTPILATLDSSSVYYIEPKTVFTPPPFSQVTSSTMITLASGTNWISIAYGAGYWIALPSANSTAAYSTDGGQLWNSLSLPSALNWTDIAYGNGYWAAISSGGSGNSKVIVSKSNGQGWRTYNLPSATTWSNITYGNGIFVAVASGTGTSAYSTDYGVTWVAGSNLPNATWTGLTYGNGIFVAVASGTATGAWSRNGVTWTSTTLPDSTAWSSIAYGNNMFVVVSSTSHKSAYMFGPDKDGTITWYQSNLPIAANKVAYGQGVFLAVSSSSTTAWTVEGGTGWTKRTVTNDGYGALCFGYTLNNSVGVFTTLASQSTGSLISAGCKTKARAIITSGTVTGMTEWEPGSGYNATPNGLTTTPPTVTFTDPNITTLAVVTPRLSVGVLSSPSFYNKGTGYNSSSTNVIVTGAGYADQYQTGLQIIVNNLTRLPQPGDNLTISGVSQIYKVTDAYSVFSTVAPNLEANISLSPDVSVANATANGTAISIRSKYSQARLTNHDFLNIGYGDLNQSNYPGFPDAGYGAVSNNQVVETNYGRVFFTSTDQDGNFKVGNLFGVQQATGIVTLSASQFGLTGLSSLSLGGIAVGGSSVVVTQFSTDGTFTANSDSVLPTQRAVKTYLTSRLSQGGANTFTGQLTAGSVVVGGPSYIRSSVPNGVTGSVVKMPNRIYFGVPAGTGYKDIGVDGNMAALDFFIRMGNHR